MGKMKKKVLKPEQCNVWANRLGHGNYMVDKLGREFQFVVYRSCPKFFKGEQVEYRYKCLLRSTTNKDSTTGNHQINLHKDILDDMGWEINDTLKLDIIKNGLKESIIISKEKK